MEFCHNLRATKVRLKFPRCLLTANQLSGLEVPKSINAVQNQRKKSRNRRMKKWND